MSAVRFCAVSLWAGRTVKNLRKKNNKLLSYFSCRRPTCFFFFLPAYDRHHRSGRWQCLKERWKPLHCPSHVQRGALCLLVSRPSCMRDSFCLFCSNNSIIAVWGYCSEGKIAPRRLEFLSNTSWRVKVTFALSDKSGFWENKNTTVDQGWGMAICSPVKRIVTEWNVFPMPLPEWQQEELLQLVR